MNIVAKKEKKFKLSGIKSQIKSILKTFIALNKDKTSPGIKYVLASQVESLIVKMLKRYKRLLKIYWAINFKNTHYKQSDGVEKYSASDIYNIVTKLLENDGYTKVCKRTMERDIKLLNEMGLLQSKIRKLGKQRGSIAHYKQNIKLIHIHKDIILEYLKHLLKESLSDKKIIGDFDDSVAEDKTFNYTNIEKIEIPSNLNEHNKITPMSHVEKSHVFNKANISNEENSNDEMPSKKTDTDPNKNNKKTKQYKFERKDVETRLVSIQKVSKEYLKQVKEHSNNDATYINALINLETAILDYKDEYNTEDILEHFLKQFTNRYKHKIWMMMRRSDGVISDYELIWEGKFRDWYPNKYKSSYVVKETYGENIRIENKISNIQIRSRIPNDLQHKQDNEVERIAREREEKHKLELGKRAKYLKKLFEKEAQEMQERLRRIRKVREEQYYLKKQAQERMNAVLKKDRVNDDVNIVVGNGEVNIDNNNITVESRLMPDRLLRRMTFSQDIKLKSNYEGFKTTKGISLTNLGIVLLNQFQEQTLIKRKDRERET